MTDHRITLTGGIRMKHRRCIKETSVAGGTVPGAARRAIGAAVALTLAAPFAAVAQEDDLKLEEVTVTARKVEENLMIVPLAITALSAKDLEANNIKQLMDIAQITPSFYFVNQTGGGSGRADRSFNSLTFRGLFLNQNQGISAGGLLFIDGAPVIGAQPPSVVDIERVEVLKGPQSAYFGRSTFVGAINFVTRDPSTDEFKGRVLAEYSRWDSYDAALNVEGPLTDTLAARLTLRSFERGGFYDNFGGTGPDRLGKQGTDSISASLVWQPTDSLKVKAFLNFFEDNDGPPAHGAIKPAEFSSRIAPDGRCVPFSQAPAGTAALGQAAGSRASFGYWCGELPGTNSVVPQALSGDYDTSPAPINNALFNPNPLWPVFDPGFKDRAGLRRDAYQGDIRIDWQFGGGYTLSSLTAYHSDKMQSVIDLNFRNGRGLANPFFTPATAATRVPWLAFPLVVQTDQRDWSQELRLTSPQENRFRWVLGANYFDAYSPGGSVYGLAPIGPLFAGAVTQQFVETPAVFGAAYFDVTDTVTISAEARQQRDEIRQKPIIGPAGTLVTGAAANELSAKFDSFSPRVSIDWEYAPDSILYALFSRGFRPGGFNNALATASPAALAALTALVPSAALAFDEEQLDNYEIGIKSTWLDGRARTTLTVYKGEWQNGQVGNQVPVTVAGTSNLFNIVINNGVADLQGVEFEGSIQVTQGLRLSGNLGYNDTEIKSYGIGPGGADGNCVDCNQVYGSFAGVIGRELPTVPKLTWSVSADYSAPLTGELTWYTRGDYQHQGRKYTDFSAAAWVGDRENLNARIGIRGAKWSAEVFGTNLTDDDTFLSAYYGNDVLTFLVPPTKNEVRFAPPIPRAFGIRATYEF